MTKNKRILKKDNRAVRFILIFLIMLSLGVMVGIVSYTFHKIHEFKSQSKDIISYSIFNTTVEVTSGTVGLNADTDALKYGKIMAGGGGTRYFYINTSEDSIVEVYLSGEMARFLSVENNSFLLPAGSNFSLPVYLSVPNDTQARRYNGQVHVVLRRPN